jgi:hypothetical protein
MRVDDFRELGYLHDADVFRVIWDVSQPGNRVLALEMRCHPDAGHPRWNGKAVRVTAEGVFLLRMTSSGHGLRGEEMDGVDEGVSEPTAAELRRLAKAGCSQPRLQLTVALTSGARIELACESLNVSQMEVD